MKHSLRDEVDGWSEVLRLFRTGWRKRDGEGSRQAVMAFLLFSLAMGKFFHYCVLAIYILPILPLYCAKRSPTLAWLVVAAFVFIALIQWAIGG